MNQTNDIERLLDRWLADGPSEAHDRVIETVADRIERQPQRPAWRLLWREIHVTAYIKPLLAAAVAILIVVAGVVLFRPTGDGAGGVIAPSPSPTPSPSPSPSPIALPTAPARLAAGTYAHLTSDPPLTFTVPAGWFLTGDAVSDFSLGRTSDSAGDGFHVWYDMRIASKDAACTEAPEPGVGHDAASIVADLASNPGLVASSPQPITVAGLAGQYVDVALAPTWKRPCPFTQGHPSVPLITDVAPSTGPFWGVEDKNRIRVIALDVGDGTNMVITVDSADGTTFDSVVSEAMPVIGSFKLHAAP